MLNWERWNSDVYIIKLDSNMWDCNWNTEWMSYWPITIQIRMGWKIAAEDTQAISLYLCIYHVRKKKGASRT